MHTGWLAILFAEENKVSFSGEDQEFNFVKSKFEVHTSQVSVWVYTFVTFMGHLEFVCVNVILF